ncbi:class I mannose-6-phosphate isomerase, partial [Faecalibacillus intestinalis]|uniref:class I mannose-6-phosphate isomerase n=1 Tax=Faecalibacillus intestinalis TaxID=1982626 RepID=UPI003FEE88A4
EEYALKNLGCHGKSESWYIVNCPHNADIVMGHNAKTIQELDEYIQNKDWKSLLKRYPIFPGAFYNIQAGTLHAIQKGTTFMEVCNPCPVTYRFYDYDRLDKQGKPRQLDVEKAKDNILVPFECQDTHYSYRNHQGVTEIKLTDNKNFSVYKYVINGSGELTMPKPYLGAFVIEGQGQIEDVKLQAGDSFLISANVKKLMWKGEMTVLAYYG